MESREKFESILREFLLRIMAIGDKGDWRPCSSVMLQ